MGAARLRLLLAFLVGLLACHPTRPAQPPVGPTEDFEGAVEAEARTSIAMSPYLGVLEAAAAAPDDPWSVGVTAAALDALLWRKVPLVPALAQGVTARLPSGFPTLAARLRRLHERVEAPWLRGLYALALHDLALRVGAPQAAHRYRRAAGCPREVALAGPVTWPPLGALGQKSPLQTGAPLPERLAGPPPFAREAPFTRIDTDACRVDVDATSPLNGERLVVVDLEVPKAQSVHVMVTSTAAAAAELQGRPLLSRPFDAGRGAVTQLARAEVEAGRARLVVRVAQRGDAAGLTLHVWGARGEPLAMHAPRAGERAGAEVTAVTAVSGHGPGGSPTLRAAVDLALGRARAAWSSLEAADDRGLTADLMRLRALSQANLLPRSQRQLELEAIATRILDGCPRCWEAEIVRAVIAQRRGSGKGAFSALERLGVTADYTGDDDDVMRAGFVALAADAARLDDVVRRAYGQVAARAPTTALVGRLDEAIFARSGPDAVKAACKGSTDRSRLRCFRAQLAAGDPSGAFAEMKRLRELRGSLSLLRGEEVVQRLAYGDVEGALRVHAAMLPARRSLDILGLYLGGDEAKGRRLLREGIAGRGAPRTLEPLSRLLGLVDDPSLSRMQEGAALVAADREQAFLPGAGTAVLRRDESYTLEGSGLLRYTVYDLRRVSDSIDVASGTWMGQPMVGGRQTTRVLLRRIHKKDGRILDPDPGAQGRQFGAELSQLQAGDYVEVLLVGWALPDDAGQLVLDSPDLMPPRTSLRDATVTWRRPEGLKLAQWQHPRLGEGDTVVRDGVVQTRWRLTEQTPRRIEEGVPPLEARVGFSVGTDSWRRIARALGERFRALDEDRGFMQRWAEEAVGDATEPRVKVERVVARAGKEIVRSDPGALSDFVAALSQGGQRQTARWFLARENGSRTWVIHRALRALGIESRIAVAESRPFSAAADFPPRPGRFTHPVVMVELGGETVFIDADTAGQPMPVGRVSPNLRGRKALLANGRRLTLPASDARDVDEVDLRLSVQPNGDATGSFTARLSGRDALRLADAFTEVVGTERERLLRNVVLGWLPQADVSEITFSAEAGVLVRAEVTLVGYLQPTGRTGRAFTLPGVVPLHRILPRPSVATLSQRYAAQAERSSPLGIRQAQLYRLRRKITLPAGTEVVRAPAAIGVQGGRWLKASRRFAHQGDVIEETFSLDIPVGTVEADQYAAFAERARSVDEAFLFSIGLKLPASTR